MRWGICRDGAEGFVAPDRSPHPEVTAKRASKEVFRAHRALWMRGGLKRPPHANGKSASATYGPPPVESRAENSVTRSTAKASGAKMRRNVRRAVPLSRDDTSQPLDPIGGSGWLKTQAAMGMARIAAHREASKAKARAKVRVRVARSHGWR